MIPPKSTNEAKPRRRQRRQFHMLCVMTILHSKSTLTLVDAVPSTKTSSSSVPSRNMNVIPRQKSKTQNKQHKSLSSPSTQNEYVDNDDFDAVNDLIFGENHYDSIQPKRTNVEASTRQRINDKKMTLSMLSPSSSFKSSMSSPKKLPSEMIRLQSIRTIANSIIHDTAQTVSKVLRGDVAGHVPADIYGQTLEEEVVGCNSFHGSSSPLFGVRRNDFDHKNQNHDDLTSMDDYIHKTKTQTNISNKMKLYGGAQYHRVLQSYHDQILTKPITSISPEEVSLLIHGISDTNHDGTDLLRSVAILSSRRMDVLASDLLKSLAQRIEFVFFRMWKVVEYTMTTRTLGLDKDGSKYGHEMIQDGVLSVDSLQEIEQDMLLYIKEKYLEFVQEKVIFAYRLASGDIDALMKFVSWDIAFSNGSMGTTRGLSSKSSSTPRIVQQQQEIDDWDLMLDDYVDEEEVNDEDLGDLVGGVLNRGKEISDLSLYTTTSKGKDDDASIDPETQELLIKIMHAVRDASPIITSTGRTETQTYAAVNTLVQHVTNQWRMEIARLISTKFNAFCLVAFHDEFGTFLRRNMNEYIEKQTWQ